MTPELHGEALQAHEALHDIRTCPNCGHTGLQFEKGISALPAGGVDYFGHPDNNGCLLVVLVTVLNDRGQLTERQMYERLVECDADKMWAEAGPVIDSLERGELA